MGYSASIVIPLLNQRIDWLRRCVLSALHQTVPTETILVFSRATKANTARPIEHLAGRHECLRVLIEERPNFAAALNTGFRAATANRIGILLSDDWLEPEAVEQCLAFDADIVSTGMRGCASDGKRFFAFLRRTPSIEEWRNQPTLERKASYLKHFLLFRKDKLLEVGGVDEEIGLTGPDDFDLVWTLLERGASVGVVGTSLYNYRDHSGQRLSLRDPEAQIRDLRRILDKHKVPGTQRQEIIAWHSSSYGKLRRVAIDERKSLGLTPPSALPDRCEHSM